MLHLRLFLISALICAFCSCKKEELSTNRGETPTPSTSLLKKVVSTNYDNTIYTTEYTYDNEKRPTTIAFSSNLYTWKNVVDIEYSSDSKLKKATYRTINDSNLLVENIVSYTFIY